MAVSITVPVMSENDATAARLRGFLPEHAACSVAKGRSPRYHSANALIEFSVIRNVHISRIDLNLLAIFDTIYAEGSITRASRRLNLSQPAISHALGRLRQMIDVPLLPGR